jgi:hypothetical protein
MASDTLTPTIVTGLPAGIKARPRADFIPTEFDQAITTKGYRMFWSRAGICPCTNNDQTEQPDPTCGLCKGDAYYYFLPDEAIAAGSSIDSEGNAVLLNAAGTAVQIYVLMTSLTQDVQVFEKFGEWVFGMARATTQPANKLGYRDRLTAIDSEMTWAQIIEYDGSAIIPVTGERNKAGLRYPFVCVHQLRSLAQVFRVGSDFVVNAAGEIRWLASPPPVAAGERLSVHGVIHPTWIVMDHMHTFRDTQIEGGSTALKDQKFRKLPIQTVVKLDFLANPGDP